MQRQQTLESIVATRRWVAQILGSWAPNELAIQTAAKHALYVPIQELPKFAEEHFEEMMPPTSAVTLTVIRQEHPLLAVAREGRYALPELIVK